ncbi:hypothetical protein [Apibacter sp. HY039]|uniref:hypothetical protein n=1 Tax=Apibacter sp. HY039 TaxID=2501476 RepID=UPI000FEC1299|nr:hypothetical protein [Apibacter sp. HY039]
MKKQFLLLPITLLSVLSYSQVGINTTTPLKTLHVNGSLQIVNELSTGGSADTAGSPGSAGEILTSQGEGNAPTWEKISNVLAIGNISNAYYIQGTSSVVVAEGKTADVPGLSITLTVPPGKTQTFLFTILGFATQINSRTTQGIFSLLQNDVKISSAFASKAGQFVSNITGVAGLKDMPVPVTFLRSVTLPSGTYNFKVQYKSWVGSSTINYIPTIYKGYDGDNEAMLSKMQILVYNNN